MNVTIPVRRYVKPMTYLLVITPEITKNIAMSNKHSKVKRKYFIC